MRRGFSLVELVIVVVIIGIVGAIAIPRMSGFAGKSKVSRMIGDLTNLQGAGDRYAAEHWGRVAGKDFKGIDDPSPMNIIYRLTKNTDENGKLVADGIYGPYLRKWPVNIANGKRTLRIDGAVAGADTDGWRYDSATGVFEGDHADPDIPKDIATVVSDGMTFGGGG